jgi:ABC-type polar amino acid transport system ATPase subunit
METPLQSLKNTFNSRRLILLAAGVLFLIVILFSGKIIENVDNSQIVIIQSVFIRIITIVFFFFKLLQYSSLTENLKLNSCVDLSSGEQQLLLLASALLHNAKITIFDELTANLDLNRVKDVFDILNSSLLSQKIVITHNLDFAYALKDFKVLFLQKGSLKFFGSHSEFFIQENLNRFYGENLKLLDSHLVLDL